MNKQQKARMHTVEKDTSQRLRTSNLNKTISVLTRKTQHNLNEVDEVVFSHPVGQWKESFRWQRISNHAQVQLILAEKRQLALLGRRKYQ